MKRLFFISACFIALTATTLNAQNKGHFILGTDLVNYETGNELYRYYSNDKVTDSNKTNINLFSSSLNIWAGYFVSKKVALGLRLANIGEVVNTNYNMGTPFGFFFRYYPLNDSASKVSLFFEGIAGAYYSSATTSNGYSKTVSSSSPLTVTDYNVNAGVGLSINATRHLAFILKAGLSYSHLNESYSSSIPNNSGDKAVYNDYNIAGQLKLQYKI